MITHSRRALYGLLALALALAVLVPVALAPQSHAAVAQQSSVSVEAAKVGPGNQYVPCRNPGCHYWAMNAKSSFSHYDQDGNAVPITLRCGGEHVVYSNAKDHVMNVAWAGEDTYGPFAFDRVRVTMLHGATKKPIHDPYVWDPASRWGQRYVGRDNQQTGYGVLIQCEAWWGPHYVRVVTTPKQVVEGELAATALALAS